MRNYNNSSNSRNNIFIICFIVIAIASVIVCIIAKNALEKSGSNHSAENSIVQNSDSENSDTVIQNEDSEISDVLAEDKIIPTKLVGFPDSQEKDNINTVLVAGDSNTCMLSLSDLADETDKIDSLTFIFRAENGVSNLGQVKLGFGISVDEKCPDATSDSWYQTPGEAIYYSDGAYCTALWSVPDNLKDYINNSGNLLFGYWWSDYSRVVLEKVICKKTSYVEIPADGTKKNNINASLTQENGSSFEYSVTMPIASVVDEGTIPQRFGIKIKNSSGNITDLDYSLGITTTIKSDDNYYYYDGKLIGIESDEAEINWIIPDLVRNLYDPDGNLYIKFIGDDVQNITVENIIVDYTEN